jgi:hypothetical protein
VTATKPSASISTSIQVGVAVERLVHGVVDHLGEQVMQRLLVGAADIHARPPAHRLEPFEHLDVARAIARITAAWPLALHAHGWAAHGREAEQVAGPAGRFLCSFAH